ncbi:MAG: ABC transporter ATP-binding protein, partial [Pseudooceanicola sp.]|nr:ABC transporter ATP-binding protein [Pseudooceanicola sp.]
MKDHLSDTAETVLDVTGLAVRYATPRGQVHAVDKLDLTLRRGEVLGIIGESGCGKSTAAYAILGLLPGPGRVSAGSVRLMGEDLLTLPDGALRRRRWSRMALIPQGAMNALNPTMTVARLFAATMRTHGVPKAERAARTADLLARVGLP